MLNVLDKGYVRLADSMGSDLSVVNAARVSYDKESQELNGSDERLLQFLVRHGHSSPFRHAFMTFEVYAPLFVARQWFKYVVGSVHDTMLAWNESSRRYVTETPEFYIPKWRTAPPTKQGSGKPIEQTDVYDTVMRQTIAEGVARYEWAMEQGVAAEQARCLLPAYALYVRWRWSASLAGVMWFLQQRLAEDAQWEIQQYAQAVRSLASYKFPLSIGAAWKTQ
jgi:thymidylate synthase (FAD)